MASVKPRRFRTPVSGSVRAAALTSAIALACARTRRPLRNATPRLTAVAVASAASAIQTHSGIRLTNWTMACAATGRVLIGLVIEASCACARSTSSASRRRCRCPCSCLAVAGQAERRRGGVHAAQVRGRAGAGRRAPVPALARHAARRSDRRRRVARRSGGGVVRRLVARGGRRLAHGRARRGRRRRGGGRDGARPSRAVGLRRDARRAGAGRARAARGRAAGARGGSTGRARGRAAAGADNAGVVSGSWSVVPLLPELSVPWLPASAGFWVTQVPPVPEPSVPEPLVSVAGPVARCRSRWCRSPSRWCRSRSRSCRCPNRWCPCPTRCRRSGVVLAVVGRARVVGRVRRRASGRSSCRSVVVELESLEQVSEPLGSVDGVVVVSPEPWSGSSRRWGRRWPVCRSRRPRRARRWRRRRSRRPWCRAVAGGDANALGRVRARRLVRRGGVVGRGGSRGAHRVGGADRVRRSRRDVRAEADLVRLDRGDVRAEAGRSVDDPGVRGCRVRAAQCEPPRPSAPATPKTAAPAALISATEHSHLLRSMILSRHRVIAVPDSIPVPRLRALNHSDAGGGYSPS